MEYEFRCVNLLFLYLRKFLGGGSSARDSIRLMRKEGLYVLMEAAMDWREARC